MRDGPGEAEPVVGGRAAAQLVDDDEALVGGVPEQNSSL